MRPAAGAAAGGRGGDRHGDLPGVGTVIGGVIGGIAGGALAGGLVDKFNDGIVDWGRRRGRRASPTSSRDIDMPDIDMPDIDIDLPDFDRHPGSAVQHALLIASGVVLAGGELGVLERPLAGMVEDRACRPLAPITALPAVGDHAHRLGRAVSRAVACWRGSWPP